MLEETLQVRRTVLTGRRPPRAQRLAAPSPRRGRLTQPCLAVVQIRNAGCRFPDWPAARIHGRTVLAVLAGRLRQIDGLDRVVVATSDQPDDDLVAAAAAEARLACFRGPSRPVIERTARLLRQYDADVVLRVNGSSPLFDPDEAAILLEEHVRGGFDFSYNEHHDGIITGMGCDVVNRRVLEALAAEGSAAAAHEFWYIRLRDPSGPWKLRAKRYELCRPDYRVSLDTRDDLDLIADILRNTPGARYREVVAFLDASPAARALMRRSRTGREVGLGKLVLFPAKLARLTAAADDGQVDTSYPVSVELSLTNRCNLQCVYCSDRGLRDRLGDRMTADALERLYDDLAIGGTRGVVIEGGGEPTISPLFTQAVRAARRRRLAVGLITNGVEYPYGDLLDHLEWVRVSLDAASPEQYAATKQVDRFDRVLANLADMAARRACVVGVGYVVTRDNTAGLEELVMHLRQIGVDYVQFRPVIDHPDLAPTTELEYLKKFETERFAVMTEAMGENADRGNDGLGCVAHSLSTVIAADGSVYLCGRLNVDPDFPPIGNVVAEGFDAIWKGLERRRQAAMVRRSEFCRMHCPQCRLTKYNVLMHQVANTRTVNFI